MTFKERVLRCETHPETVVKQLLWDYDPRPNCEVCGKTLRDDVSVSGKSATVIGDECDVWVRHGICNEDGTPKRYTSKADMRDAARAKGLENRVQHVPLPDSDKSPHTSRWI